MERWQILKAMSDLTYAIEKMESLKAVGFFPQEVMLGGNPRVLRVLTTPSTTKKRF